MAATTTITISGTVVQGLVLGSDTIATSTIQNVAGLEKVDQINLVNSTNTITVPTGAKGIYMIPPAGNAVALTLKGVGGDTGFGIAPNGPMVIPFPSPAPASFVISAAAGTTGNTAFFWI